MTDPGVNDTAARGFARNAADYERSRPSYPAAAVACLVGRAGIRPGRRVVDLAAGTGKLTRLLVPTGADVVAVEPVEAMRRELMRSVPGVEVIEGTAEELPFPDGSVAVVTVAQAFHWFDPVASLAEMGRVLEPGGCLALVWNTRDRRRPWVREFGELLVDGELERPYDDYHEVDYAAVVARDGGFSPLEAYSVEWEQIMDADLLVARAASISVVGALPDSERGAVLERVRTFAATHPDLAGRQVFGFPYTTRVLWCYRS